MNTRKHMRRNGGVQPRNVLTCADAWPQAWTYVTRENIIHTRASAHPTDYPVGPRHSLTARELSAEAARMIAAGWLAWELCAALGCDGCQRCTHHGCDSCGRWSHLDTQEGGPDGC